MFVKIYAIVLSFLWLGLAYFKHGEIVEEKAHDFRNTFTSFLIYLPLLGRVLNWW